MGQEIVYCCRCQTRLTGADFDKGTAKRVGDNVCCTKCEPEYLASLTPEEREALKPKKPTTLRIEPPRAATQRMTAVRPVPGATGKTGIVPKVSASSGKTSILPKGYAATASSTSRIQKADPKSKTVLWVALGGAGLLLVVILIAVASSGKSAPRAADSNASNTMDPAVPIPTDDPVPPNPPPPPPVVLDDDRAPESLKTARRHVKEYPNDFVGQVRRYEDAFFALESTPSWLSLAKQELDAVRRRQIESFGAEFVKLDAEVAALIGREELGKARELLDGSKRRYPVAGWENEVGRRLENFWKETQKLYEPLRDKALEARSRGASDEIQRITQQIRKWGLNHYITEIEKALAGAPEGSLPVQPKPKPPPVAPPPTGEAKARSKEGQAYLAVWEKAMALATARDFAAAVSEIERANPSWQEAAVKSESAAGLADLRLAAAAIEEAIKATGALKAGTPLAVSFRDGEGNRQQSSDLFVRADPFRLEMQKDGAREFYLLEFSDVTADWLAETFRNRPGKKAPTDDRAAALLCLLEGEGETARAILGGAANSLDAKYWTYAAGAAAKIPKTAAKDLEARKLFHAAHVEFHYQPKKGAHIEKYKRLLVDFADTAIVRREIGIIARRSEGGKDYVFLRHEMAAAGTFRGAVDEKAGPCWMSGADAADPRPNYVEVEFYALPDTVYKAWVYAGSCCAEKFGFDMQATDLSEINTKTRQPVPLGPGADAGLPVKQSVSFKSKTHAAHAAKKDPHKWDWVALPIPKYPAGGLKKVRVLCDKQNLAVAFFVVSSSRTGPPKDDETKELAKIVPPARVGTREPAEWLMVGPFDNPGSQGYDRVYPPEQGIDLGAQMDTKAGKKPWKVQKAQVTGNKAYMDFTQLLNPKDNMGVYVLIHVKSPAARDATLTWSHDDGGKAWLNGTLVSGENTHKGQEYPVAVKLIPGWNRLMIKIVNGSGGFNFSARLSDAANKPLGDLEYDPYGDLPGAP